MCIAPRPSSQRISKQKRSQHSYLSHDLGPKWHKPLEKRSRKPASRSLPNPTIPAANQVTTASSDEAHQDQVIACGSSSGESPIKKAEPSAPMTVHTTTNATMGSSSNTKSAKSKTADKADEKEKGPRYWTPAEHQKFLEALEKFHFKDNKSISDYVGTRSPTQVRTHAQKYFLKLQAAQKSNEAESSDAMEQVIAKIDPCDSASAANADVFSELRDVLSTSGRMAEDESTFAELLYVSEDACDLLCDSEEDLLSVSVTEDDLLSVSQAEGYDSDGSCQNDVNDVPTSCSSSMAASPLEVEEPLQQTWGCHDDFLMMDVKHMHDLQDLMEIDDSW